MLSCGFRLTVALGIAPGLCAVLGLCSGHQFVGVAAGFVLHWVCIYSGHQFVGSPLSFMLCSVPGPSLAVWPADGSAGSR